MKHTMLLPVVAAFLSGCAPLTIYHKAGIPVAQLDRTELKCDVAALRDAPVATQTRRTPPVFIPPRRICDAAGTCTTRNGYWEPGTTYTVDVNEDLRNRVKDRCMAAEGLLPVKIERCPPGIAKSAPVAPTRVLPRLTPQSCVIIYPDDSWQIVTRG